jgi:hypothetical protein
MAGCQLRRRVRRGQATVEFAFCLPLYLLVFFATIDASLWAIQTAACVSASEQAARLGASVLATSSVPFDLGQNEVAPLAPDVTKNIRGTLQQAMFGTTIRPWCRPDAMSRPVDQLTSTNCTQGGVFSACPTTPDQVRQQFGDRVIAVCVQDDGPGAGSYRFQGQVFQDPPSVTVKVIGFLASLVPPAFGLGWRAGEIPIDIGARVHAQRFTS